jgi:hypothetical protein
MYFAGVLAGSFSLMAFAGSADPPMTPGTAPAQPISPAQSSLNAWWSLKPLVKPAIPAIRTAPDSSWVRTPIDRFILAKLEEKGLAPSPPADKRTLLRRVTFDLIGLPPTRAELDAFLADESSEAYDRVVDRLLASPHFGERWARHWMDVVHYAETHGHDQDRPRPNAWPYRDYLVRSFNDDKPYARFVQEQVAGDRLYPDEPDAIVALGMLATGPWDESSLRDIRDDTIDRQIGRYLDRDDIVSTVMSAFASTTVHCARCHDHKFDPITQKDYYAVQAVFAATDKADRLYDADPRTAARRRQLLQEKARLAGLRKPERLALLTSDVQARVAIWEKHADSFKVKWSPLDPASFPIGHIFAVPAYRRSNQQRADLARYVLRQEIDHQLAALPAQRKVYAGTSDFQPDGSFKPARTPRPIHVLKRGDINKPGEEAQPGALACVNGLQACFQLSNPNDEGGRRVALARWLTDPNNVLLWRSIVNRVWHYHFGCGIVDTPNDLGRMGGQPSNPELLDWLAVTFRDSGGSLKQLHRLLVTSAVYRQSSQHQARLSEIDAENRYLWRMNRSRLDAESLRDAVLLAAGKLDRAMGGPSVKQFNMSPGIHVTPNVDYVNFDMDRPENYRRSVYRFVFRTLPDPFMQALDCVDSSQLTAVRSASVTPLQALAMLHNKFMIRMSEHLAERAAKRGGNLSDQIRAVYELTLNRAPTAKEARLLTEYAAHHGLANACRMVLNSNEFMFVN